MSDRPTCDPEGVKVRDADWNVRTYNVLAKMGLANEPITAVAALKATDILAVGNAGRGTVADIQQRLAVYGLALAEPDPGRVPVKPAGPSERSRLARARREQAAEWIRVFADELWIIRADRLFSVAVARKEITPSGAGNLPIPAGNDAAEYWLRLRHVEVDHPFEYGPYTEAEAVARYEFIERQLLHGKGARDE